MEYIHIEVCIYHASIFSVAVLFFLLQEIDVQGLLTCFSMKLLHYFILSIKIVQQSRIHFGVEIKMVIRYCLKMSLYAVIR